MAEHESGQTFRGRETNAPCKLRLFLDERDDPAYRGAARRNHQIKFAADREWHHAGSAGFDQPLIVDRALRPWHAVEAVEGQSKRVGKRAQVIFFTDRAGGDQHPLGADADRQRALRGLSEQVVRKTFAQAIDFRAERGVLRRTLVQRGIERRRNGWKQAYPTANSRPLTHAQRHTDAPPRTWSLAGRQTVYEGGSNPAPAVAGAQPRC